MVLACGMCGDMLFRADAWWATAVGLPFVALLIGMLALTTFSKPPFAVASVVIALGMVFLSSFIRGPQVGVWFAAAFLLVALLVSLVIHRVPRWFNLARVSLVVAAMISGFIDSQPWNRETPDLLRVALYVQKFPEGQSWLYGELLSRPETRELLEQQLVASSNAVRLHRALGYAPARRSSACHALRERERKEACPGE